MASDITVQTWDEAQQQYRTRLQARLASFFCKDKDPYNTTPMNAIMQHVPVHLLEQSKTGVAEINLTVKLMRNGREITDLKDLCPVVNVNIDARNPTPGREQLPHIGFSVQNGAESHVFVRDPLPMNFTVRGPLKGKFLSYGMGPTMTPRGKAGNDEWHVQGEMRCHPSARDG